MESEIEASIIIPHASQKSDQKVELLFLSFAQLSLLLLFCSKSTLLNSTQVHIGKHISQRAVRIARQRVQRVNVFVRFLHGARQGRSGALPGRIRQNIWLVSRIIIKRPITF